MTSAIAPLMHTDEARRTVEAVNHHLTSARALLLDLYQREGWRALGYSGWRECAEAEFGNHVSYLYRQLSAAEVEIQISPIGEIGQIPESQLRPLTPYKNEPEFVQEAWQKATATAPAGKLTAAHVTRVIEEMTEESPEYMPIGSDTGYAQINQRPSTDLPQAIQPVSRLAVHHSSKSAEHYTPKEIIEAAIECLKAIDLDPCSNSHDSPNVPAAKHFTQEDDGLGQPWQGRVYMNPPYGNQIGLWVEKLASEHEAGNVIAAIALVPARTDTQWFHRLRDYPCCFVEGRLKFLGNTSAAPFPSAIFYLGEDIAAFYYCFADAGDIWQRIEPGMFAARMIRAFG